MTKLKTPQILNVDKVALKNHTEYYVAYSYDNKIHERIIEKQDIVKWVEKNLIVGANGMVKIEIDVSDVKHTDTPIFVYEQMDEFIDKYRNEIIEDILTISVS
jgi:hypothetical protein